MTTPLKSLSDLLPEVAARISRPCEAFDEAWGKGGRPRIEDFLDAAIDGERRALLFHLLRMELELRRGQGEAPAAVEYQERFPGNGELIARAYAEAPTAPGADGPAPAGLPEVPGFKLMGRLGEGGMGDVYLAEELKMNRQVALKLIRCGWGGRGARDRARDEAQALARLQDPQVVTVYDVDEYREQPYLSLEYVQGGSLADRLKGIPQPPREAAQLIETLALTIHRIHGRGLAHRDLKPANILLAGERGLPLSQLTPKITDFGLVKYLDAGGGRTSTGLVLGTPSYMAPEQARGENDQVDHRADVYALGAVLYECLTGRPPFRAANAFDTLLQVVNDDPVPIRRLNPAVDEGLAFICMKCLAKVADGRYHSAAALAADLRLWIDGEFQPPRSLPDWFLRPIKRPFRDEEYHRRHRWNLRVEAVTSLVAHLVLFALLRGGWPGQVLWAWMLLALFAAGQVNWWSSLRRRKLSAMERDVLILWTGVDVADLVVFAMHCPFWGPASAEEVVRVYPIWAVMHGLIFFVEGHFCWGRLYLVGALYFAAGPLLLLAGAWAPVAFGLLYSAVFVWLSCHTSPNEPRRRIPPSPPAPEATAAAPPGLPPA